MHPIWVDKIPANGMEIKEMFGVEWANSLIGVNFHTIGKDVMVNLFLTRTDQNVFMKGLITTRLGFSCSRCAEDCFHDVNCSFSHLFSRRTGNIKIPHGKESQKFDESSFSVSYYDAMEIDAEPVISEEFLLSLPPYPLCSVNCKGVCQFCGKNLNAGVCDCKKPETDSRWDKLKEIRKTLKKKRTIKK